MIYSFIVFGLVETIEDLPASPSSCSLDDLEVYWDTLSQRHLSRNPHVDFYPWHKSVLVQTHQNLNEQVS
jgi:hypothetical protein